MYCHRGAPDSTNADSPGPLPPDTVATFVGAVAGARGVVSISSMYSIGCTPASGSFVSGHPYANAPIIRYFPASSFR